MRYVIWIAAFLFLIPSAGMAQESPKVEVFGGYSFLRVEGGDSFNGWQASVAGNVNNWFGIVAEFSGHYDSRSQRLSFVRPGLPPVELRSDTDTSIHSFLFGPRFSYRKHERVTPFVHGLIGLTRTQVDGTATASDPVLDDLLTDFETSDTNFSAVFGGGVDINLSKRFALRLVQADYQAIRNDSFTLDNARVSTGLVIRW
ncbi:MAG TPA: outer membrane beta-barrel protein [Blastocatellia bacterium]|nr:outer membrane beta-barrel protein [Blastocatellia bacterium]